MKSVRITAPIAQIGNVQLLRGRKISLPDAAAELLIARNEAEPMAENTTMQRPRECAVMPRPFFKPKPTHKGRR